MVARWTLMHFRGLRGRVRDETRRMGRVDGPDVKRLLQRQPGREGRRALVVAGDDRPTTRLPLGQA